MNQYTRQRQPIKSRVFRDFEYTIFCWNFQRINFELYNENMVLVIFNSAFESQNALEQCMLLAFARAVGGEVYEMQAKPSTELKKLILSLTPTGEV